MTQKNLAVRRPPQMPGGQFDGVPRHPPAYHIHPTAEADAPMHSQIFLAWAGSVAMVELSATFSGFDHERQCRLWGDHFRTAYSRNQSAVIGISANLFRLR